MIKMAICDDDITFCEQEENSIKRIMVDEYPEIEYELKIFYNSSGLQNIYAEEYFDVIFLDIEIGRESGFEVAKSLEKIHQNTNIIFITTYENLVYQSFQYRPLGFVRKQMFDMEFVVAMRRIIEQLIINNKIIVLGELKQKKIFSITEIRKICTYKHYVQVQLENEQVTVRDRMSKYIEILENDGFIMANRGLMVNMKYIKELSGNKIIMYNGGTENISRSNKQRVIEEFEKYQVIDKQK